MDLDSNEGHLLRQVERFLYREARLLDDRRFHEWLDLFTEDAHYFMPSRRTRQGTVNESAAEGEPALTIFNDGKQFLETRIKRLDTGLAHSERPASRTRHLITNVEVEAATDDELTAYSNFLVFQARLEGADRGGDVFFGKREDRLRKLNGEWKIAHRTITMDQTLLPRTLSIFF